MIKYNLRYRGPFEYDKLILNILQFSNEVKLLKNNLNATGKDSLDEYYADVDNIYNVLVSENNIMSELLKIKIKME